VIPPGQQDARHAHDPKRLRLFETTATATFLHRPNRFVVTCLLDGRALPAYLPNPGRLRELLLPGRKLYLAKNNGTGAFTHTVVAVERDGRPVMLHTHMANRVAEWLLRNGAVPGCEDAIIVRREAPAGRSRFDFLIEQGGARCFMEVKSCTLFEGPTAMFPDAVTSRGRRHLLELADMSKNGMAGKVIIIINSPGVRWFLPDYHTDPAFADAMLSTRGKIGFTPLAVDWNDDLTMSSPPRMVTIPWDVVEREARDSGSYILLLRFDTDHRITVGRLGTVFFPAGYYCYAGSAKQGLSKRIARHLRKRKNHHWHIDYLRNEADQVSALPIRSSDRLECNIAASLDQIADWSVPGFGCSDCSCDSHLFGMLNDPWINEEFIDLLQYFRIGRLRTRLERPRSPF